MIIHYLNREVERQTKRVNGWAAPSAAESAATLEGVSWIELPNLIKGIWDAPLQLDNSEQPVPL